MTAEAFVNDGAVPTDEMQNAIRAARAGDAAAFEEIMVQTERHVAVIAWRILGDAEEVKDAMQETFLRLFRHLHRYDERHELRAWLTKITVNVCRDQLRRRRRLSIFQPLPDTVTATSDDPLPDAVLSQRDDAALLGRAIDSLPPKERLAVILRDIEGLSTQEVAAALGNTVATVRVQLSRARIKLRRFLEGWQRSRP